MTDGWRGGRRSAPARVLVFGLATLLLSSCAPEPVAGWHPPHAAAIPGVSLVLAEAAEAPQSVAAEHEEGEVTDPAAAPDAVVVPDEATLGVLPGRIRNDGAAFAARFVYVPGVPEFNARINNELWAAIGSREAFAPEAFPTGAGLGERGCVPGSVSWNSAEVLARPETGPVGGAGTAVTCEITGAFGDLIEVRIRVVKGSTAAVTEDRTSVLFADVASGALLEAATEWNASAPEDLWRSAVELLRRQAGSLSSAPLTAPDASQLSLATEALESAVHTAGGGLLVTLQPGLVAVELEGLGVPRTEQPTLVRVEPATALAWSNEDYLELHRELDTPFTGVRASASSVPIDCSLLTCVALTYDDGPSEYTPRLLDTLRTEQARATFYMLGRKASGNADTILRVVGEGNEIGSHTMNHPDLTTIPVPEAVVQVRDAVAELERVSGHPVTTFRPPYGAVNDEIVAEVGMPSVHWSVDTNDWQVPGQAVVVERAVTGARPGGIVLFHDTHSDTVDAADEVIRGLRDRGFEMVTVTQLFDGSVPAGRVRER